MTHEEMKARIISSIRGDTGEIKEYIDNLKHDADLHSKLYGELQEEIGELQEEIGELLEKLQQITRIAWDSHVPLDEISKIRELTKDIVR